MIEEKFNKDGQRICNVEGCGKKHKSKGFCNKHYLRVKNHRNIDGVRIKKPFKECSIDGCKKRHAAIGFCAYHYRVNYRTGSPIKSVDPRKLHNRRELPEYIAWKAMRQRCNNKNSSKYEYYGGRGISICDRWMESFENFLEDMSFKPSKSHSLDRINVAGNYEPSNCRWADATTQRLNIGLRKDNTSGKTGVTWDKKALRWKAAIKINKKETILGWFKLEDKQKAIEARKAAELKYYPEVFGNQTKKTG